MTSDGECPVEAGSELIGGADGGGEVIDGGRQWWFPILDGVVASSLQQGT